MSQRQDLGVPLEGGPAEAFVRERASATPSTPGVRGGRSGALDRTTAQRAPSGRTADDRSARREGGDDAKVVTEASLRALQHWFAAAVMHPDGVATVAPTSAGALHVPLGELERVILPSKNLTAIERLAIYGDAYRSRLVECLADDYPALQYALGDEDFEALCLRYIARHPSTSPNLNSFGRHMALFCRTEECPPLAFAGDLAALEWAMVEVLHAPSAAKLDPATLARVPPGEWAGARFAPSQTVRVLELSYPVNAFFQAFRTDQAPSIPAPAWSATVVFRDGATIWRMDLGRAMHALLMMLFGGTPLGPALEAVAASGHLSEEEGTQVMVWFRDWVKHGFFAGIETS